MGRAKGTSPCRSCGAPVVFFRSPFTSKVRTFDPTPVDGHHALAGALAYPVQGLAAYLPADLAELVQVQRGCSDVAARDEVADMTWHVIHQCPNHTSTSTEKETTRP